MGILLAFILGLALGTLAGLGYRVQQVRQLQKALRGRWRARAKRWSER